MRAGAFAETRVIDLVNRRFVPYFYETTGGGKFGTSKDAAAFVNRQTKNRWAFLAAFTPEGKHLGSSGLYDDKNAVFDFLVRILAENPGFSAPTSKERAVLSDTNAPGASEGRRMKAARLLEELGQYEAAKKVYVSAPKSGSAARGLARIGRYQSDWALQKSALDRLRKDDTADAFLAVEDGYRLLARKEWKAARTRLQRAARRHSGGRDAAELHFYAGLACWLEGDKDWARFHWGWILDHRTERDRLWRRAWVAAADEAMNYPNTELRRPKHRKSNGMGVSVPMIDRAARKSLQIYRRLRERWAKGHSTGVGK